MRDSDIFGSAQGMRASAQDLLEALQSFQRLRILVIGDAMLDSYLEGTASRLCSEGPVPVVRKTSEQHMPGGAANTALNIQALGAQVDLLGLIGDDPVASSLRQALGERQLPDRWLISDAARQTQHKMRILADNQYVVRLDEGQVARQVESAESVAEQTLLANLERLYTKCDAVIISDYGYGTVSLMLIERLRALQTRFPRPLLVDSKELWRFRELPVTVITPNAMEALSLHNRVQEQAVYQANPLDDKGQVLSLAHSLLKAFATQYVVMTLGADGIFLADRERLAEGLHIPARPVARANDVGAGDSFASALIVMLAAGVAIEDAVRVGIEAANIVVTKAYTATVSRQELLQRISLRISTEPAQRGAASVHSISYIHNQVEEARRAGRTIVLTNGVFDILHVGHVNLLRQARQLGDVLVVAINSDQCTRKLKGPTRPINREDDRLALVAALDMVDYALLFDDDTPERLIRLLRPDIHVKGGDYMGKVLPEEEAMRDVGGQLVILPFTPSFSTSRVIERIVELSGQRTM